MEATSCWIYSFWKGFWSLLYDWSVSGITDDYWKHTLLYELIKRRWKHQAVECRFYAAWWSIFAWHYNIYCNVQKICAVFRWVSFTLNQLNMHFLFLKKHMSHNIFTVYQKQCTLSACQCTLPCSYHNRKWLLFGQGVTSWVISVFLRYHLFLQKHE